MPREDRMEDIRCPGLRYKLSYSFTMNPPEREATLALFRSPHPGFVQNVRASVTLRNSRGDPIGLEPALRAEFGVFGPEQPFTNPETGESIMVADVRGGFFDSLQAQEANGWSDEDREYVELILRQVGERRPDYVQEVKAVHVPAPLPWATYDTLTDCKEIVELAQRLSLVPETIRYERENLQRPDVLAPLEDELAGLGDEDRARAEPRSEVPAEMLEQADPQPLTVGKAPEMTDSGIVKGTPGLTLKPQQIIA